MKTPRGDRQAALSHYPRRCLYCGFGIEAVLEVAHLDCNRDNCGLDNLAVLCPTCHRMHDLDLIPTDIIVRLRDDPPEARWSKLQKDGPQKAAKKLKQRRAALKAVATRRARMADRLASSSGPSDEHSR